MGESMRKNVAVILAAGSGIRSGFGTPKQLMKLAGKPVIEHALLAFEKSEQIDEIAIVTSESCLREIETLVLNSGLKKIRKILLGGAERWHSSWAAIEAYGGEARTTDMSLIFHDAVRPLVDDKIIERVIQGLQTHRAVDVVIKAVDTVVKADPTGDFIAEIPDRSFLRSGQTPQAFHYEVIRKAYERAKADPQLKTTDDCGVVLRYSPEEKIYLVEGSQYNQKLTYNEDLAILERLFQFKRGAFSHDPVAPSELQKHKNKVFVITGGTSGIGAEMLQQLRTAGLRAYSISRREGVDIADKEAVEKELARIHGIEGRIDCIANSAGVLHKEPFASMRYEDLLRAVNINYLGALNMAYAGCRYLQETKGSLLFFTSSSYTYGRAYYSVYSSSKAAIVNLTQALAEEWSTTGVRVNCLNPERTLTPMRIAAFGHEAEGTLLKAESVATVALKLLIGENSGLVVDVKKESKN